jgi:hypothetical protein
MTAESRYRQSRVLSPIQQRSTLTIHFMRPRRRFKASYISNQGEARPSTTTWVQTGDESIGQSWKMLAVSKIEEIERAAGITDPAFNFVSERAGFTPW